MQSSCLWTVPVVQLLPDFSLHHAIKTYKFTLEQVRTLLYQLLCGIHYMHSMEVMHRDLKVRRGIHCRYYLSLVQYHDKGGDDADCMKLASPMSVCLSDGVV